MNYQERLQKLIADHEQLICRSNAVDESWYNGVFARYENPVLTAAHTPLIWRYDFDPDTNPYLMERMGMNAVFNAGAIELNGKFYLCCRVEGVDRKSFFAIAESDNGIDNFRFWDYPMLFPEDENNPETNIYDMRLVHHEDGWIYGIFCVERHDPAAPPGDLSSAIAQCGLVRSKDLRSWDRLPDIKTNAAQQRNVVLHPEFVDGKYALYTRPQDSFIDTGTGGGIGWGLCEDITHPEVINVGIMDPRAYHTIKETKNGMGAPPIKTEKGWLHIAHGVRNTAAGLRYVLYAFLCELEKPDQVIAAPGGYVLAPVGRERVGDVSNVLFSNGIIARKDGSVYLYYASSDTRLHVATSSVDRLLDYVLNTPEDGLRSHQCVKQRYALIEKNLKILEELDLDAGQALA